MISGPLKSLVGFMTRAGDTGNLSLRDDEWAECDRLAQAKDETGQSMKAFARMMRKFVYYGETLKTVAANDLTVKVETLGEDDTFGNAIESVVADLNNMFANISAASNQVSTGSVQIADGAQLLAQGATEQSATVEELSASVTEVNAQTRANAGLADDAKKLGEDIRVNAERGTRQMEQMIVAVGEISDASTAIGRVIKIIDDIAFQTNILALNAAVEAARAGQHGKGFAVVADEVRSLAAKSAEAAKNTSELIATSMGKSEQGAAISKETAASLVKIVEGINQSGELVAKIAKLSNEQTDSMAQIGVAIDQVSQVIQQNSATAEESAAASQELSSQAMLLRELIAQFKLKQDKIVPTRQASAAQPAREHTGMAL
jgi:methyl-accepting chemotaxis protein